MTAQTAFRALGRGLAAGAVGTVAITLSREAAGWIRRGRSPLASTLKEPRTWADAPAPAQVARKAADAVGYRVTKRQVPVLASAVHWSYGIALGSLYGLVQERIRLHPLAHGAIFGTAVWALRHAVLPPLEVDEPIWKKSPGQLALDLSHHLAYGLSVAGAHRALGER